jgi:hypothetical protein
LAKAESTHLGPTSVYRYFDGNNLLVYVGITSRGIKRNREHNDVKSWWQYVVRQEVEHFDTRSEAAARERALIREYRPPYNIQHNPDHASTRAAYEAFRNSEPTLLDGKELMMRSNNQMPLHEVDRGDGRYWLSTEASHWCTAKLIMLTGEPLVSMSESRPSKVDGFQLQFPYALIRVCRAPKKPPVRLTLTLKWRKAKQQFEIAQVSLFDAKRPKVGVWRAGEES